MVMVRVGIITINYVVRNIITYTRTRGGEKKILFTIKNIMLSVYNVIVINNCKLFATNLLTGTILMIEFGFL